MKIKKFNENTPIMDFMSFMDNEEVKLTLSLNDLFYDSKVIFLMKNGQIFENIGSDNWEKYDSKEDFHKHTDSSLDNEYKNTERKTLLKIVKDTDIEKVYYSGYNSHILDSIITKFGE